MEDKSSIHDISTLDISPNDYLLNRSNSIDVQNESDNLAVELELYQKSSNIQAYFNTLKVFLGNAWLTIPYVYMKCGWLGGLFVYLKVAVLNLYTMQNNVEVASEYSRRPINSNGDTKEIKQYIDLSERVHGKVGLVLCIIFMFIV